MPLNLLSQWSHSFHQYTQETFMMDLHPQCCFLKPWEQQCRKEATYQSDPLQPIISHRQGIMMMMIMIASNIE